MSAKGRGTDVVSEEFYPTPAWCTRRILEALPSLTAHRAVWLEPCAGDGAIAHVLTHATPDSIIDGGDIRDIPKPWSINGDWLAPVDFSEWTARRDAVITNPPFSLAGELIDHFLPRCDWLILLLRSSFKLVNASGRDYRGNMPDEYKLPQRPEFIASEKCDGIREGKRQYAAQGHREKCGWAAKTALSALPTRTCPDCGGNVQRSTTDASEYSWFVWTPDRQRTRGHLSVLQDTTAKEREACR